jgi:hypothetical protein
VRSRRRAAPAAAVLAAVAVALALALLVGALQAPDRDVAEPGPPLGAVLDDADRRALAAVPVRRGAASVRADPGVDLHDPVAVARAYLAAVRAGDADDRGRTRLNGAGYAEPGSPPAAVGVVVLDAPPPGQVRTAAVTALDLVAADEADLHRGYRAVVTTATGPVGGAGVTAASTSYLVLARQPDGRWLVAADTPDVPEVDD